MYVYNILYSSSPTQSWPPTRLPPPTRDTGHGAAVRGSAVLSLEHRHPGSPPPPVVVMFRVLVVAAVAAIGATSVDTHAGQCCFVNLPTPATRVIRFAFCRRKTAAGAPLLRKNPSFVYCPNTVRTRNALSSFPHATYDPRSVTSQHKAPNSQRVYLFTHTPPPARTLSRGRKKIFHPFVKYNPPTTISLLENQKKKNCKYLYL